MEILLQKQWNYSFSKDDDGQFLLYVFCGTVGLFGIGIVLNAEELEQYQIKGEIYIDELARQVCHNPGIYTSRKIN